ncbi:transcriptional regulator PpsR [Ciceribacter sp. L1K22]|uniref:transcriptional regulator PpsR n=1 Tax=Ciceribacter sp. L1K22 TaxID=2820275 RepID=UPI001ABE9C1A|nr:transcriptional regulator PpsR [Ciceribacter sp. L1K22]MBO3761730.1 transcriptional regulator PpsR [Ciceribacter sp. L1K22]
MKPLNGKNATLGFEIAVSLLKSLDIESIGALVGLGADIVMLVDKTGKVASIHLSDPEIGSCGLATSVGRRLQDIVTIESVPKIDSMLSGLDQERHSRGYQVNHSCDGRPDLPVVYSAFSSDDFPYTLVVGRDLRQQMRDQQRLVETQMALEADYRELQEAEARYRTAFRVSSIAHLMIDGERKSVLDANAAAIALLGTGNASMVSKPFRDLFRKQDRDLLSDAIAEARHSPDPVQLDTLKTANGEPVSLTLRSYRENGVTNLIVSAWSTADVAETRRQHIEKMEPTTVDLSGFPEAAVQTNGQGQVVAANAIFLDLVHAPSLAQVLGRNIATWFSKSSLDIHVLYSRLAEEQNVRGFSSTLTDNLAGERPVLISARRNPDTSQTQMVIVAQANAGERLSIPSPGAPEQADGFANLVGKVPLKELMRESLDVIEKICIEAALDQTNNNRASAAEILGLSRQSLYIKLRRHGLEDYRPAN